MLAFVPKKAGIQKGFSMGNRHIPGLVKLEELTAGRAQLMGMVESIDRAIVVMKKVKVDKICMYSHASLKGNNGGIIRLGAFTSALEIALRRLSCGNPITIDERKPRSKPRIQKRQKKKTTEDLSMDNAFQEAIQEMAEKVKKIAEKVKTDANFSNKKKQSPP